MQLNATVEQNGEKKTTDNKNDISYHIFVLVKLRDSFFFSLNRRGRLPPSFLSASSLIV